MFRRNLKKKIIIKKTGEDIAKITNTYTMNDEMIVSKLVRKKKNT